MVYTVKVVLAVTGSVASVLTVKMILMLQERGHEVKLVHTEKSEEFLLAIPWSEKEKIEQITFESLGDEQEWTGNYIKGQPIPHVELAKWADVLIIAPISANTLAKIAVGICDNLVTCVVRAWHRENPIIIAPAMNTHMWTNPFTAEHINKVEQVYNCRTVYPVEKELACGDEGIGALAPIEEIIKEAESAHRMASIGKS